MKLILSCILFFVFASFALAADKSRDAQIDDIREALFRHQFAQQTNGIRFLSLGEKGDDPSDQFLKRFANSKLPVRKVSSCKHVPNTGVPIDKKTGASGIIYSINTIKWISDTEVEAKGSCHMANEGAEAYIYALKKDKGVWRVIKEELTWIS